MKIVIKKKTQYQCEYVITRLNKTVEQITLETKTYFAHDICHYVVEKQLGYSKGFWGMLADGNSFIELFGKENPITTELRFIETIVGPIQSFFLGHMSEQNLKLYFDQINYTMKENALSKCLDEIKIIMNDWGNLSVGQQLVLEWNF